MASVLTRSGDRRSILQRRARDLGRVDDALLHEVAVTPGLSVTRFEDLARYYGAVLACILGDLAPEPGAHAARC